MPSPSLGPASLDAARPTPVPTASARPRLRSLDALRGFDMFWIVGGGGVGAALAGMSRSAFARALGAQFEHADWYGLHFWDTIFPLFLFLVGVGAAFSIDGTAERSGTGAAVHRIVRRALLIYFLGVVYNGGLSLGWAKVRWIGVLQEIGECYLIAGLLYCACGRRLKAVAVAVACLLLAHWALLTFVPFPDLTVTPEGIAPIARRIHSTDPAAIAAAAPGWIRGAYDHAHNLANYLDFRFLPGKKPEPLFAWEGLLSPLSACTLCLLGILAGRLLRNSAVAMERQSAWLCAAGVALVALGLLWSLEMPVVKKLWSSSFCLIGAGYGAFLLGLFHWMVEVKGWRSWCTPFVWIGANPITIYILSGIVRFRQLAARFFGAEVETWLNGRHRNLGSFVIELAALVLIVLVARFLYRRSIFLRL
jgi:predicted acyltransferase